MYYYIYILYIVYIIYILYISIYTNSHNSRVTTIPRCRRWIKKSFPGSPSSRAVWRWPSLTSRSLTDPFVAMLWLFDPLVTTNYGSPKNHVVTISLWGYFFFHYNYYNVTAWWWLEPWNFMTDFPIILGISYSQLTNSIIFQRGRSTTNQKSLINISYYMVLHSTTFHSSGT